MDYYRPVHVFHAGKACYHACLARGHYAARGITWRYSHISNIRTMCAVQISSLIGILPNTYDVGFDIGFWNQEYLWILFWRHYVLHVFSISLMRFHNLYISWIFLVRQRTNNIRSLWGCANFVQRKGGFSTSWQIFYLGHFVGQHQSGSLLLYIVIMHWIMN